MKSIRASLILGSVAGAVIIFSLSAVAIYRGAKATLVRQLDENLIDQVRVIASVVKLTPDGMEVEIGDIDVPEFASAGGYGYLEVWLDPDSVLYRSPSLKGRDLERSSSLDLNQPVFSWARAADGAHVRAVEFRTESVVDPEDWEEAHATPPKPSVVRLIAAEKATDIDAFLARLRRLMVAVSALGGLAIAGLLAVVVRRSLRPLDNLAREIGNLSDSDLSTRIRIPIVPREMEPVVNELNQLLARLEDAFARERTFSADIAHELRTPIAGLRSTVEVALSRPREGGDYRDTLQGLLDIIQKVQAMVETLLYLGRLEAGQVEIEQRTVDLRELVQSSWKSLAETAQARRLVVSWNLSGEVNVTADPILLEVAIRNVLENAVTYADEGGRVRVEVVLEGERGFVRVANSGSHVPQERVGELLRRFTRADPSRRASGEHFGLGLALATKIAAVLRCSVDVTSQVGGEFVVTLTMASTSTGA
jgi:two-component system, OmpR family, heavy metal sensor histidine kinase CusS